MWLLQLDGPINFTPLGQILFQLQGLPALGPKEICKQLFAKDVQIKQVNFMTFENPSQTEFQ